MKIRVLFLLVGNMAFFGETQAASAEAQKRSACVAAKSCQTAEFDSIIQKIVIDYYDDLGSRYRWTHMVPSHDALTDCEAAIREYFPYSYEECQACQESEDD